MENEHSRNGRLLISDDNIINNRVVFSEKDLLKYNNNYVKISKNGIYITGCIKNCGKHIRNVYVIIKKISQLFENYTIIFSYDKSDDNSLDILKYFSKNDENVIILENENELSEIRTENISNARNLIIEKIKELNYTNYKYFIMMDMDDVCDKVFHVNVFKKYIINDSEWDSISFNRTGYYDIWALSYDPYVISCWHYYKSHTQNRDYLTNIVRPHFEKQIAKLKDNDLLKVQSAFGGFAIYKIDKFINCSYNWKYKDTLNLIPKHLINKNILKYDNKTPYSLDEDPVKIFDCEHRFFHLSARKKNKARIRVSPFILFGG